jgi:hypothetical protein
MNARKTNGPETEKVAGGMAANHLPDWSFYCRELLFAKKSAS